MFQDVRYGVRMLFRQPGISAVILLTLALGIGVNTALFTMFNALVLKPLPIKDVDSIVEVQKTPELGQQIQKMITDDIKVSKEITPKDTVGIKNWLYKILDTSVISYFM